MQLTADHVTRFCITSALMKHWYTSDNNIAAELPGLHG